MDEKGRGEGSRLLIVLWLPLPPAAPQFIKSGFTGLLPRPFDASQVRARQHWGAPGRLWLSLGGSVCSRAASASAGSRS